jgi:hypothetical protein
VLAVMFFPHSKRPCVKCTNSSPGYLITYIFNVCFIRFPKLTEEYFEKKSWPDESDVARLLDKKDAVSSHKYLPTV